MVTCDKCCTATVEAFGIKPTNRIPAGGIGVMKKHENISGLSI